MPKLYAIPVTMYVQAFDEKLAAGVAELNTHLANESIRKSNSGWVKDTTTLLTTMGTPKEVSKIPDVDFYKKAPLVAAFGEDKAIMFLNTQVNKVHL